MCKSSLLFFLIVCYYDVKEKIFPYMRDGGIEVKNFGEIFKTFRESRGLLLKDVAKAGISTSQLSRFEKGETDLSLSACPMLSQSQKSSNKVSSLETFDNIWRDSRVFNNWRGGKYKELMCQNKCPLFDECGGYQ